MAPTLYENDAKPGDLIEIQRGGYDHWAVYIGGNEVVHLTVPTDAPSPFGELVAVVDSGKAEVRRQKIWEVVGKDNFVIKNHLDDKYEPRERHAIVRDACMLVGRQLPYSLITNNCEHFATNLRYGKPESRQVTTAAFIGGAVVAGAGILAGIALLATLLKSDKDEDEEEEEDRRIRRRRRQ